MLVEISGRCSPIALAVQDTTRVQDHVEVDACGMDALSETLRVVCLVGAIFINENGSPRPGAISPPPRHPSRRSSQRGAERVVIFHMIAAGECYVEMGAEPPVRLIAGDVVIFPERRCAPHGLDCRGCRPSRAARLDEVLARRPPDIGSSRAAAAPPRDWSAAIHSL